MMTSRSLSSSSSTSSVVGLTRLKRRKTKPGHQIILAENKAGHSRVKPANKWETCRLWYYAYAKWVTKNTKFCLTLIRLAPALDKDDVKAQARFLLQEHIVQKLKKQELYTTAKVFEPYTRTERIRRVALRSICEDLELFTAELEKLYPELFAHLAKQLKINFKEKDKMNSALCNLCDELFSSGVTWGRIITLFSVASTLAVESVQANRHEMVGVIVDTVCDHVVETHLASWIVKKGGWGDMRRAFRTTTDAAAIWSVSLAGVFIGCIVMLSNMFTASAQ